MRAMADLNAVLTRLNDRLLRLEGELFVLRSLARATLTAGNDHAARMRKLVEAAKVALDLLQRAIIDTSEPAPASNHIPLGSRTSTLSLWRRYCYEGTIAETDNPDTKQKAYIIRCRNRRVTL